MKQFATRQKDKLTEISTRPPQEFTRQYERTSG
jgi:hypothetical protein